MTSYSPRRFVCFDLEGPLSPQDNAYEVMRRVPPGKEIFEAISRYDDVLVLEPQRRYSAQDLGASLRLEDYQPGDTLALIVPFLVLYGVSQAEIADVARSAGIVASADSFVGGLQASDVTVCTITTSYSDHALAVTRRVGIEPANVACTHLPLDSLGHRIPDWELGRVRRLELDLLGLAGGPSTEADVVLKDRLDDFFWRELAGSKLGAVTYDVKPVGGQRKVQALNAFAERYEAPLASWFVVGDSITDRDLLRAVDEAGGLSVAFNANAYALAEATMSMASTHLADLEPVWQAWAKGGREAARDAVDCLDQAQRRQPEGRCHYHWLSGQRDVAVAKSLPVHANLRRLVREEAGSLG